MTYLGPAQIIPKTLRQPMLGYLRWGIATHAKSGVDQREFSLKKKHKYFLINIAYNPVFHEFSIVDKPS